MSSPIGADTERALRDAMDRLLTGHAEITHGRLSIAALATEAQVSRATLYRAPHIVAAFQQAIAKRGLKRSARNGARATATRAHESDELRELRALTRTMAQHIQALTLLTVEQKRRIEALSASPPRGKLNVLRRSTS
jgi:hypothetical protein